MLVLPNMDPALHASRSSSVSRTFVRHIMHAATRLSVCVLKILCTAIAMLFLPRTIQICVQCLDDMYEMMGRRARSPWQTQVLWGNGVLVGLAVMFVLHDLLRRISYSVILSEDIEEENQESQRAGNMTWSGWKLTWERILMRIIVPALLAQGMYVTSRQVLGLGTPIQKMVNANTVDLADGEAAQLL